jgi:hypothetical protein
VPLPPAFADVIRGQVDIMFVDTGNALPRVGKDGLRALDARIVASRRINIQEDWACQSGLVDLVCRYGSRKDRRGVIERSSY